MIKNLCAVLILLGILYLFINHNKESFLSGLLLGDPVSKGPCAPGLSDETYASQGKLMPRDELGSYCQTTNNKKEWATPCNGTTPLPELCGGLYKKRKIQRPPPISAPPLSPQTGVRVNFYVSDLNKHFL